MARYTGAHCRSWQVEWECDIPNRLLLINKLEERVFVLQESFDVVGREIFFVENQNYVIATGLLECY